jgi:hypothetical protein
MTTFVEIFGGVERLEDVLQRFLTSEDQALDWPEYADVFIIENDTPAVSSIFENVELDRVSSNGDGDVSWVFDMRGFETDDAYGEEPLSGIFAPADGDSLVYPAQIFIEHDSDSDRFKQIRDLIIL